MCFALDGASLSAFNRVGTPEEVVDVSVILAGDAVRWVTGQNIQARRWRSLKSRRGESNTRKGSMSL